MKFDAHYHYEAVEDEYGVVHVTCNGQPVMIASRHNFDEMCKALGVTMPVRVSEQAKNDE